VAALTEEEQGPYAAVLSAREQCTAVRVVVVAKAGLVRLGIQRLLRAGGIDVVAEVEHAGAALALVRGAAAEVVLIDATPSGAGAGPMHALLAAEPRRTVVLVETADDRAVLEALGAGAHNCVAANASPAEIIAATEASARGDRFLSPRLARRLGLPPARATGRARELTSRERQILALVVRGWDNAQIGEALYVSPGTIKHHLANVFKKLEVANRVQAAVRAVTEDLVDVS
jgi:two-component system nitrate/nitrite response regulator NarL